MERFLSQCASYIFDKHGSGELHRICLVFPNRRSGVFFNAYLQKLLQTPVIGPKTVTINEFISGYSKLHLGEKLQMISTLYEVFRKHTGTRETFDDFYFWGEVLLADFNEIDNYLINAKDLFTNLAGLKEIEYHFDYLTPEQKKAIKRFWGALETTPKKPHNEKFISIWQRLYPVYAEFKQLLKENETGYPGMIYREVVEQFDEKAPEFEFSHYYIIGLNALNNCEKSFFRKLVKEQKASFLWDYDSSYLEDVKNEAGRFMRENLRQFPPPDDFESVIMQNMGEKNINLVAVSSNYGQTQVIPGFLEEIGSSFKREFDNTAVVLADESLLYPAISSIPETYGTVNVTMGYPVKNSVVYGFLLLLINLLKNKRTDSDGKTVVYHRFVTDILNHQLLGNVEPEKTEEFLLMLKRYNRIMVDLNEIDFSELHRMIFSPPEKVTGYSRWFLDIAGWFYRESAGTEDGNLLLGEIIYSVYQTAEKLENVVSDVVVKRGFEISDSVYFRLFSQYVGQVSVAFEGEPLSGIQVMGVLETRCLDFKNVVVLGLNENKWPRTGSSPSFIPYNLRKGFGLPGIDDQDAIYAYYFYRLIQRPANVTATYNTMKEGIGTGELSRYGFQLLYDSDYDVKKNTLDFKFANKPAAPIVVEGSAQKNSLLLERISNGTPLSPTAVNTWLQCSLRFYFRYILQLPEPDEMKDEIDNMVFGNIFHEVVENLYRPFTGKIVSKAELENIRKNKTLIDNEILKAIGKHYFMQKEPDAKTVKPEGKTILFYENMKTFITRLLEIDSDYAPFHLIALENNFSYKIDVFVNEKLVSVPVGGKIDRIDEAGGKLRIIDYKTGNVSSFAFENVEELFERDKKSPKKEILQALAYCMFYKKNFAENTELMPAIFSLRKMFDDNFSYEIKYNRSPVAFSEIEDEFEANFKELLSEVFSDSVRYYQTPHYDFCRHCAYNKICQRY